LDDVASNIRSSARNEGSKYVDDVESDIRLFARPYLTRLERVKGDIAEDAAEKPAQRNYLQPGTDD
jgi:hypothetical protein